MSDLTIEIFDSTNIIEIESSIGNTVNNLDIDTSTEKTLELLTNYSSMVVYASDIIGLDDYLSNFIDNYEIDCGTP